MKLLTLRSATRRLLALALGLSLLPAEVRAQVPEPPRYYRHQGEAEQAPDDVAWPDPMPSSTDFRQLIGFDYQARNPNRFAIDRDSISLPGPKAIRFILVITSPQGARNVSMLAIRCNTADRKLLATGRDDGGWNRPRGSAAEWRKVGSFAASQPWIRNLYESMCEKGLALNSPSMIADALNAKSTNNE